MEYRQGIRQLIRPLVRRVIHQKFEHEKFFQMNSKSQL
jgi:hypothetical protein